MTKETRLSECIQNKSYLDNYESKPYFTKTAKERQEHVYTFDNEIAFVCGNEGLSVEGGLVRRGLFVNTKYGVIDVKENKRDETRNFTSGLS